MAWLPGYDIVNNTFIGKDKGEKHAELEVEIGDIHSDDFQPQFKIKRWDNECNFSVRLLDDMEDVPKLQTDKNKIKFVKKKTEAHFYDVPKTEEMPECFEFEIVLKEKPKTNKIQMSIETKGLAFYYQPELTQRETDDGAFRPENVIGSYAVYHESKAGDYSKMGKKNYRAGKAFHIYRPKIIDNAGKEVWGKLNITDNLLTVEIPQEFLDNAVYPVIVDPTFGYTSKGLSEYYVVNYLYTYPFSCPEAGTATNITFWSIKPSSTDKLSFIIYDASNRIAYSTEATTETWGSSGNPVEKSLAIGGGGALTATTYYMGFFSDSNSNKLRFDSGGENNQYQSSSYVYPPPATWTKSQSSYTRKFSIYCTYTAAGAGVAPTSVFIGPFGGPFGGPIQ